MWGFGLNWDAVDDFGVEELEVRIYGLGEVVGVLGGFVGEGEEFESDCSFVVGGFGRVWLVGGDKGEFSFDSIIV